MFVNPSPEQLRARRLVIRLEEEEVGPLDRPEVRPPQPQLLHGPGRGVRGGGRW